MRALVRGAKARGLEVLVHVQCTHMGEGTDEIPDSHSIRGIDVFSYYQIGPDGTLETNPHAPGTTVLDPCSEATRRLIVDALRKWRTFFGVDGFVLDTGGGIQRGPDGRSVLLEAIANDPALGGGGDRAAARSALARGGAGEVTASPTLAAAAANATAPGNEDRKDAGCRVYLTPGEFEIGRMQNWGVIGERVTPAYARDVTRFLAGSRARWAGSRRACAGARI